MVINVPDNGFGMLMGLGPEAINTWLNREIGRGEYANHGVGRSIAGRDVVAFYFRSPDPAARFLSAFPQLALADGTLDQGYSSPTFPFGRR